ncbi:MAG: hypothetical protein F6K56_26710 [Moorea sp. SIO3G5]|nr:hypothetical protein [Moorena sp. SIO3G5]
MSYSMNDGMKVAKQATADITSWLLSQSKTISVQNVEQMSDFQRRDIDLIWTTQTGKVLVEIKGDRWHKTGNFFFETDSNREKGTPGCFMYTEADWLFYYFVIPRTLYLLPMPATREWFLPRIDEFPERSTTTPVGGSYYTTIGRLVPIKTVMQQLNGVQKVAISPK